MNAHGPHYRSNRFPASSVTEALDLRDRTFPGHDKGKPTERWGRKVTDLKSLEGIHGSGIAATPVRELGLPRSLFGTNCTGTET
jgi:hypothetical protein